MQDDRAPGPINDHGIVISDLACDSGDSGDERDIEIARNDGRMGCLPTRLDGEGDHMLSAQPDGLGRSQVMGNDDDIRAQLGQLMVGHALQGPQQVAGHISQIVSPLLKPFVLEPLEASCQLIGNLVNGPFRIDPLFPNPVSTRDRKDESASTKD